MTSLPEWWSPDSPASTPVQRKRIRRSPEQKGHAWTPGTGPAGETCGSCQHIFRNRQAKTYLKCELMRSKWTSGYGTDIHARDAACKFWMPKL